jgi:hypothetical protein
VTAHNSSTASIAGFLLAWSSVFKTFSILPRELSSSCRNVAVKRNVTCHSSETNFWYHSYFLWRRFFTFYKKRPFAKRIAKRCVGLRKTPKKDSLDRKFYCFAPICFRFPEISIFKSSCLISLCVERFVEVLSCSACGRYGK